MRSCFGIGRRPKKGDWGRRDFRDTDEGLLGDEPVLTREGDRPVLAPWAMGSVSIAPLKVRLDAEWTTRFVRCGDTGNWGRTRKMGS